VTHVSESEQNWQNFENNGSEKKELLERKIGGEKSKIGASLTISQVECLSPMYQ